MATTRGKAEAFRKELDKAVVELQSRYGMGHDDVVVTAQFTITDMVRYSSNVKSEDDGE